MSLLLVFLGFVIVRLGLLRRQYLLHPSARCDNAVRQSAAAYWHEPPGLSFE